MINIEMARDYLLRAKRCLKEAKLALHEGDPPMTIRRSQEALELATKAVLRYLAIEYPREHDVGDALTEIENKLPSYLRSSLPELKQLLTELAELRGPAFYGYEREGIPASKAFSHERAETIFQRVKKLVKACSKFLTKISPPTSP